MDQQQRYGGGRDALNPGSLAYRLRLVLGELLPDLVGKAGNRAVIEIRGQGGAFVCARAGNFIRLAVDVALVLGRDFQLLDDQRIGLRRAGTRQRQ